MRTSTIPQRRTGDEVYAVEVAMSAFACIGVKAWSTLCNEDELLAAIRNFLGTNHSFAEMLRIVATNPAGLTVRLDGGREFVDTLVRETASQIVFQIIREVVGTMPVHGEAGDQFCFLGRTIDHAALHDTKLLSGVLAGDSELVDLWCRKDGGQLRMINSRGGYAVTLPSDEAIRGRASLEAYRRGLLAGLIPA